MKISVRHTLALGVAATFGAGAARADDDLGAFLNEQFHDSFTNAAGAAGDDGDLSVQRSHLSLLCSDLYARLRAPAVYSRRPVAPHFHAANAKISQLSC